MPIKRLYHKLTAEADATGFDSDTLSERKKGADVKGQRLQLIVYTALFAFIVLAAYGYYLIFNLTHDVHSLSNDVRQMTRSVNQMSLSVNTNMEIISNNMTQMQRSTTLIAETVAKTMPEMSVNTTTMTHTAQNVSDRIDGISSNIQTMSVGLVAMQRDMWHINKTFSNPAESAFDSMMPWGNKRGSSPGPLPFQPPVR
ncbi:MAG: hypothetical protein KZQ64_13925 [gamma proteobacterium symbiont of Bathyaustriella thionipta]|nr:hypothetical protein [gamma proteobacterium symbiont of Bathyaustriella thionipta]MCU7949296.1 hypothetical protein [gamma proteobacterium symbiont of Bathyaustriella thionipta]MCU7954468.1 hypothetical protein [gamma proteobacterium symbiont of Bathyaustriella thionipta]MCU7956065.1 hypothetical protein [gamma proteobacterium symbiont of Bathyaustriella thionipta]MCU7968483.1 hypothetical protein [gamma proteobacterium symbiont of Bathyaustriella thionipta]